jgi:hypothetical protein
MGLHAWTCLHGASTGRSLLQGQHFGADFFSAGIKTAEHRNVEISGKYCDYLQVDIFPANFFVLDFPPILFVQFDRQLSFVKEKPSYSSHFIPRIRLIAI